MIGNIKIETPLTLAPMAGQTNHALRMLCREMGDCGLVCTEFISSNALQYMNSRDRTLHMFDWTPEESPFAVQLFGSDPDVMAQAAQLVVEHGADIVDINMGCWVPKIVKTGAGAALLKDVDTATAVVKAVIDAVDVPVTVKVRSGFEPGKPTAVPFAVAAEKAGVKAIAIHARYANQGHKGFVDLDIIRQVKESVSIPVLGNGEIVDATSARRMMKVSGCDGVMIGRGALGNPWVFRQIAHELRTGKRLPDPTPQDRAEMAVYHARLMLDTTQLPLKKAIRELRGQLLKYAYGMPHAKSVRDAVCHIESMDDIEAAFAPLRQLAAS